MDAENATLIIVHWWVVVLGAGALAGINLLVLGLILGWLRKQETIDRQETMPVIVNMVTDHVMEKIEAQTDKITAAFSAVLDKAIAWDRGWDALLKTIREQQNTMQQTIDYNLTPRLGALEEQCLDLNTRIAGKL